MRLEVAALLCVLGAVRLSDCAPPLTCYSRALVLSDEIMTLLDKIHTYHRTVSTTPTNSRLSPLYIFFPSFFPSFLIMLVLVRVSESLR